MNIKLSETKNDKSNLETSITKELVECLIFHDNIFWIIQCFKYSICAQGDSIEDVINNFLTIFKGEQKLNNLKNIEFKTLPYYIIPLFEEYKNINETFDEIIIDKYKLTFKLTTYKF